jgi:hypothetical protein
MMSLYKNLLLSLILLSLNVSAGVDKYSITLVSVIKPRLEGFSTSGLGSIIGAATIPYVGQIIGGETEAIVSKDKFSEDFNASIKSEEVTNIIVSEIRSAFIDSNKFNVSNESYNEEKEISYDSWLEKKERLSSNRDTYLCEIGVGRIRLEDQYFSKILRVEFAIKIIDKNNVIASQATSLGDFFFKWERVESIKDSQDVEDLKKSYTETLRKISKKLAKDLTEKI